MNDTYDGPLSVPATSLSIEIPVSEGVRLHVEHLQAKLTERNKQIERLQTRVAEAEAGTPNQAALGREYQRGWRDCASRLTSTITDTARSLGTLKKDALAAYQEAERAAYAKGASQS